MANSQADLTGRGTGGAPGSPRTGPPRTSSASGSVGVLLDGRYRLLQRRTKDGPAATWDGEDDQLLRPVVIHVVSGPTAADAVDAARRSAAVEDERLPHLLDVGLERTASGTALGWVVTERSPGRTLAELLREAPLPPARARAMVGEAAAVLARASRSGLHHRRLEPTSVLLTADGAVSVLDLEVASAAAGGAARTPVEADRDDAEGLVRLLYAALTGLWPAGRCGSLGAAPTGRGGAPVAPGDLAPGVPHDLDALCAATLGPYQEGPRSPAEVAAALAPWGSSTGPVTRTGLGFPVAPALRDAPSAATAGATPDATPGVAAGGAGWASAPVRARLGGGPGLHFAGAAAGAAAPSPGASGRRAAQDPTQDPTQDPGQDPGQAPAETAEADRGTRVLRRPTVAVPPGTRTLTPSEEVPGHETRASRRAAARRAERAAAGADAFEALLGPVSGPRPAVPAATAPLPPAWGGAEAPGVAARVADGVPRARPARSASPFDDTDATDWVGSGWGAAPAGARPVAAGSRRPRGTEQHRGTGEHRGTERSRGPEHPGGTGHPGGTAHPHEGGRPRRGPVAAVLVVVALVVVGLLVAALTNLSQLAGALGVALPSSTAPAATSGTPGAGGDPAAAPPPAAEDAEGPAAVAAEGDAEVTGAAAADPFGDGTENDAGAPQAVDGDLATSWSSSTYTSAALGNLKPGVGLALVLGDGESASTVGAVSLTTQGTGGRVEVRSSPDGGYQGSTVLATAEAGTDGRTVELVLDEPATTTHLLLWFTELPGTATGYAAVVDEVSAR